MRFEDDFFPFDLSLMELAVLELTNEGIIERPEYYPFKTKEPIILTTKTAYLWGTTIGLILEKYPEFRERNFIDAYRNVLNSNLNEVKKYYSGYYPPLEGAHFYKLHDDFIKYFNLPSQEIIGQAQKSSGEAYQSLMEKGLIEDPVFTSIFGVSLAIVGFIPYGFTQKTRRGRTVYRKINALLWSYEMQEEQGTRSTNIHFRLWKILRAFKKALAEEMEDGIERPEIIKYESNK